MAFRSKDPDDDGRYLYFDTSVVEGIYKKAGVEYEPLYLATAEQMAGSALDRLEETAKAQKAYHDAKQQEFPSLDDFLSEDGELHLPADIGPLLPAPYRSFGTVHSTCLLPSAHCQKPAVRLRPQSKTGSTIETMPCDLCHKPNCIEQAVVKHKVFYSENL